ncbi:MAG: calcium:proton antiporter [Solidesulfovibrio sp.]
MKARITLPLWTIAAPVVAWLLFAGTFLGLGSFFALPLAGGLLLGVLAGVHHAEVIAHRVGEPFGTLVLAVSVTIIEVALIVSLMLAGGEAASGLARDTVFAAVMIILNGIVGICLLEGGARFKEQTFELQGATAALTTLVAISVLTLILPNYTVTTPGPSYSKGQLLFIAIVSLVLYGTFLLVQTVRHRDYFLPEEAEGNEEAHAPPPSTWIATQSAVLLMACLGAVVLLAKALAPSLEAGVAAIGAPQTLVGIIIAGIVLLPEGLAAVRAARADRLQTSLNLALGSALASIGLTIPAVAIVSLLTGLTLTLGIDTKSTVLFLLSLFVSVLSLSTGRTSILPGAVLVVVFATYLLTAIIP